jgi:predicted glycoside hydrolase/deacetylase ChbG (UPF0249 family)
MKHLIVNGDDFGASRGTNRGILEAHQRGILTSASLLVNARGTEEAAVLARATPGLSVGLHADLRVESRPVSGRSLLGALREQIRRFEEMLSRRPTHLDSHHNVQRDPRLLPYFLELAQEYGLPLREHSPVCYFSKFYGRWSGESHLEQISVENLTRMLEMEIKEGITELSCHPGYIDPEYPTGYSKEREVELHTLCDPCLRRMLAERKIQLVSYHDLVRLVAPASA